MSNAAKDLQFTETLSPEFAALFSDDAKSLLVKLTRQYRPRLNELLQAREQTQADYDSGQLPDFDPATTDIRQGDWQVAAIPTDLQKRHLEITGPVDRKMIINALNADVDVFMADFEDAQSPTWDGLMQGQINLRDAIEEQ